MHRVLPPNGILLVNVPAFESLHSPHDEAVMTGHRFRKPQIRQLLVPNGFVVRRLSYWTTLLFPLAVIARTLGGSKMGRDFSTDEKWFLQRLVWRDHDCGIAPAEKIVTGIRGSICSRWRRRPAHSELSS